MREMKKMATKESSIGFKSIVYRSGYVYNFLNQRLYDFKKKFKTIATLANMNGTKKVLDLPCGTGYLTRFLHPSITYEGWDLNRKFIIKIRKDWNAKRINLKKIILRQNNIFNFDEYPGDVDVIVFCDVLHHVFPNHIDLVENAKKHAKRIIVCEPVAVKPQDINAHDWLAKATVFFAKFLPERLMKALDYLFADNDGINSYADRSGWQHDDKSLRGLYQRLGMGKIYNLGDDYIGVWEK